MGNTESMESQLAVIRSRAAPVKLPMPDAAELEERFSIALGQRSECCLSPNLSLQNSMNLPPDKVRLLRSYDNEKKWELICDQERFQVKNPPHTYIQKLRGFLDPAVTRKKFRRRVQESTQTLRELEISLRTNHIGWVREFLNEENRGLDVLVEYLSFTQYAVTFDGESSDGGSEVSSIDSPWSRSIEDLHGECSLPSPSSAPRQPRLSISSALVTRSNTLPSRRTLKNSRIICKKDDLHVCVMCLRAIMNYQYGFNMVMSHPHAVNEIALSLNNRNPRTKALVLELLAAVCLVRGGHEIILSAFDNFKTVCSESLRFEKLMEHFKNEDDNIDFLVACMQFINIVVHSVEDMNFRVHLQYDFTKLCLEEHLERLKHTESDRLQVQIQAYLDNVFDVGTLLEDAETKTAALERVEELEENLNNMSERVLDVENEAMLKIVELEKQLMQTNKEMEQIREGYASANTQVHTLRRIVKEKDQTIRRQSRLERQSDQILANQRGEGDGGVSESPPPHLSPSPETVANHSLGAEMPPPPPPPPPPMPDFAVKIKKPIQTKFRMPVLNWVALKPSQINGTVFNDIDDEAILQDLNMEHFEDLFKTKAQGPAVDLTLSRQKVAPSVSKVSLLEANRAKNLAITLRKAGTSGDIICRAIQTFDLRSVRVDFVEVLMRFLPTESEVKILRQFERERKPVEHLSPEDRFMLQFSRIERLQQRMGILTFMGNFSDNMQMLTPQLHAMIAASVSIKSSQKLKKILEIILALGNYMNSSKRGAVYGFKLQSLDLVLSLQTLLRPHCPYRHPSDLTVPADTAQTTLSLQTLLRPHCPCRHCSDHTVPADTAQTTLSLQTLLRPHCPCRHCSDLTVPTDTPQTSLSLQTPLRPQCPCRHCSDHILSRTWSQDSNNDVLLETKSTDRTQTLLHYISAVVQDKYPSVAPFYNELHYVDKAAAVSLENVLSDVKDLQRGMELMWREFSVSHNSTLKDFISRNETRLSKLQEDARIAQDAFEDVVKFFGESSKTMPPSVFFPIFVRFIKAYRLAEEENEARRRQEQMILEKLEEQQQQLLQEEGQAETKSPSRGRRPQQELLSELRRKQVKERHVYEGKDGAIEDIITALKSVPFTARSAKRSSRFLCEPAHLEDH
uniref:Formin-like 2b n=1 Tax=Knipowitschia caucasica TaxID=637954 RepID=A0AAV2LBM3_KNICA